LKADEWKNWVLIYSLVCLKGVLPDRHFMMWSLFVSACRLLCHRTISFANIEQAHILLKMFNEKFVELCGNLCSTPNMHLHLHLKDCLLDFGSVYTFWCFSFERFNGIMGSYHINNQDIGPQMMRKFLSGAQVSCLPHLQTDQLQYLKLENPITTKNMHWSILNTLRSSIIFSSNFLRTPIPLYPLRMGRNYVTISEASFLSIKALFASILDNKVHYGGKKIRIRKSDLVIKVNK